MIKSKKFQRAKRNKTDITIITTTGQNHYIPSHKQIMCKLKSSTKSLSKEAKYRFRGLVLPITLLNIDTKYVGISNKRQKPKAIFPDIKG